MAAYRPCSNDPLHGPVFRHPAPRLPNSNADSAARAGTIWPPQRNGGVNSRPSSPVHHTTGYYQVRGASPWHAKDPNLRRHAVRDPSAQPGRWARGDSNLTTRCHYTKHSVNIHSNLGAHESHQGRSLQVVRVCSAARTSSGRPRAKTLPAGGVPAVEGPRRSMA